MKAGDVLILSAAKNLINVNKKLRTLRFAQGFTPLLFFSEAELDTPVERSAFFCIVCGYGILLSEPLRVKTVYIYSFLYEVIHN